MWPHSSSSSNSSSSSSSIQAGLGTFFGAYEGPQTHGYDVSSVLWTAFTKR
jgi:hypothetical protein